MKDEDIKLPEIDETVLQFHVKGESPKIWDHIEKWAVSHSVTQASRLANKIDFAITEAMQEYARQAVRMNLEGDTSIIQQARAWELVHNALSIVRPGWQQCGDTGQDAAVKTILDLGAKAAVAQPKPSDPEPFDLARAMAGEPIVTRDGRKVSFLGHVPGFKPTHRVIAAIEGNDSPDTFYEDGRYYENMGDKNDLFMAPKPKRTVWVNIWMPVWQKFASTVYESRDRALQVAADNNGCDYLVVAHPIEIDA